jgi:Sigma-70, region 4
MLAYESRDASGQLRFVYLSHSGFSCRKAYVKKGRRKHSGRDAEIALTFLAGTSMEEIGQKFDLSRERIRQILVSNGVQMESGGFARRKKERKQLRDEAAERDCLHRKGCTTAQLKTVPMEARKQHWQQRRNAKNRNIAWSLDLWAWWCIWRDSGHYNERGRNGYVMARYGDVGGYVPNNVYICTSSQNVKDGYVNKPVHMRKDKGMLGSGRGWSIVKSPKDRPYMVQVRGVKTTYHATAEEARSAYLAAVAQLRK